MAVLGRCTSLLVAAIITMFFIPTIVGQDYCSNNNLDTYTGFSKYLTSPNYPANYTRKETIKINRTHFKKREVRKYSNNRHNFSVYSFIVGLDYEPVILENVYRDCLWTIRADSSYKVVVLKLLDFYLEGFSPSCIYDKVTIYDGDSTDSFILRKLCGLVSSINVTSSGQYMTVAFHSDGRNNYRGFKFEYTSQEKIVASRCANVDLRADPDITFLTSPNYPNAPPGGADCQWHIASSSYSSVIVLDLIMLSIGGSPPDCTSDYVKIYDGSGTYSSLIQVLCGSLNSGKFVSTGSHMTVVFHSTGLNSDYKGFKFFYYTQEPQATPSINWKGTDSDSGDTNSESYRKKYIEYISIKVGCILGGALLSMVLGYFVVRVRRQRLQREAQRARDNSVFVSGAVANNPGASAPYAENSQNTSNSPAYPGLNYNVYDGLPNYTLSPPAYSVNPNQHQDCPDMPGWSAQQEPAPLIDDPRQTPYPKGEINFAHSDAVMRDDMNAAGDAK